MRAVSDVSLYRNISTAPVVFQVPFRLDRIVSSFFVQAGTDYNENAFGAKVYNSNNLQGFLVDGKMDDNESNNFNASFDEWRMITGDIGTFMSRTIPDPGAKKYVKASIGYLDDVTKEPPPERYLGTIGHIWQEWDVGKAPKGKYYIFLENYCIPYYKPGDEVEYMNYKDSPVHIYIKGRKGENQTVLIANLGKKYR